MSEADKKTIITQFNEQFSQLSAVSAGTIESGTQSILDYAGKAKELDFINEVKAAFDALKTTGHKPLSALEEVMKKIDKVQVTVDGLPNEKKLGERVVIKETKKK